MGKPISDDLRAHVVDTVEGGATIPEAAEQFGVSIRSVVRFLKLYRETGSVSPAQFGGYKDFALAEHEYLVRQLVAEQPDITLEDLGARLAREGIAVGKSSISRFLHHLELTFKKKVCEQPSRTDRTSPRRAGNCSSSNPRSIRDGWYSSMKPASRRRSPVGMAERLEVNGWCKRCCMGIGKPRRLLPHCVTIG